MERNTGHVIIGIADAIHALKSDFLGEEVHPSEKLAHYAKACTDITFKFPFGEHELEGIAARGNFDLNQHQQHSGKNLEFFR